MRRSVPRTLVMDHVSPATRLLEKRRQMFEVQEALELQKEEFNKKVSALPDVKRGSFHDCATLYPCLPLGSTHG